MPPNAKYGALSGGTTQRRSRQCSLQSYIPPYLRAYVLPYYGDFCCTHHFHPRLIVQLMAEGFLPIASEGVLLPKLHQQRCVVPLPDSLHISRSVRKKAKRFSLTINQCFDEVVEGCRQQHGARCWLYRPLVEAFRTMFQAQAMEATIVRGDGTKGTCPVRLYSIEIWSMDAETGEDVLVGGELGYSVGSIYTSLTGFARQDSAGSVQLAAMGHWLCLEGFTLWDLGMDMEYKRSLGSQLMPRDDFVNFVHRVRERDAHVHLPTHAEKMNARTILDRRLPVEQEPAPSTESGHKRSLEPSQLKDSHPRVK